MSAEDEIERLVADLGSIAERLDDLALEVLHEAVRNKSTARPELDRRLTRARRAVERASATLRDLGRSGELEDD